MAGPLTVPSPEQLAAADRLYGLAVEWQRIDGALRLLAARVEGYSPEAVLLKATTINSLYSTNVYAIVRVAEYMAGVLARANLTSAGPELVAEMACPPAGGTEKKARLRHSFASKFAHFFIDPDRFPILDRFSEGMVRWHVGGETPRGDRYLAFAEGFRRFQAAIVPERSIADLDHYLLIAGQARAYRDGRGKETGSEMRELLKEHPTEVAILAP